MEQHIDVLPRIIEPSMMANFDPKKDLIMSNGGSSCLSVAPSREMPSESSNVTDNEINAAKISGEDTIDNRFVLFKQNVVIVLIVISIMVVIYVFYKFYYYQKNNKESEKTSTKQKSSLSTISQSKEPLKENDVTAEEHEKNRKETLEDASKYIHLDQDDISEPEEETTEDTKMTKMKVDDMVHETYDVSSIQVSAQELVVSSKEDMDTASASDRFSYIVSDNEEKEEKKVSFQDNVMNSIIQSTMEKSTDIQPLKISSQHIERDVDSILKDIKHDELINPFILDSFKMNDTASVHSEESEVSTYSDNRHEELQDEPNGMEEEKKKSKKVSRKISRPLKIRNKN